MPNADPQMLSSAMLAAVAAARRWLGATSPNPPVGAAALDAEGRVLAVAAHQRAGEDHAEAALLKICREAGFLERVHTVCCTLEPCTHRGRTPPCSEALIAAGIRHVAIGARDTTPKAAGGIEALRAAGVEVIAGVGEQACRRLAHAFLYHAQTGKPFITVKRAFDAAGSMIPPVGQKTFTSPEQLKLAHRLRKKADAIITGSGTILADNPVFTVRHVEDFPGKRRILAILDRRGRVSASYMREAEARGFEVMIATDVDSCLESLVKHGIRDILVESGPILSQFILDSGDWAMAVDIDAGRPGDVKVMLNERAKLPFDTSNLDLESLLPI